MPLMVITNIIIYTQSVLVSCYFVQRLNRTGCIFWQKFVLIKLLTKIKTSFWMKWCFILITVKTTEHFLCCVNTRIRKQTQSVFMRLCIVIVSLLSALCIIIWNTDKLISGSSRATRRRRIRRQLRVKQNSGRSSLTLHRLSGEFHSLIRSSTEPLCWPVRAD